MKNKSTIFDIPVKESNWLKIKASLENDMELVKKLIEDDNYSWVLDKATDQLKHSEKTPQDLDDAKKKNEVYYHIESKQTNVIDYTKEWLFITELKSLGKFPELIRIVAEEDCCNQISQSKKYSQAALKEKLKIKEYNPKDRKERNERNQKIKERQELFNDIPSSKIIYSLDKVENHMESLTKPDAKHYKLSKVKIDQLAELFFNIGRAYQQSISKPYEPTLKQEIKRLYRMTQSKQRKIEYWGKYIFKQRRKYMNLGMKKDGKAISRALIDAVEKYGKENDKDYDRRLDKYDRDKAKTEQSIKEHIRSNYWHHYKKKHSIS